MPTLNLGIVAHVDAGKTTLTERLLYETGVITQVGRVDHGSTTTDTDALERRRGITIRSAVVTFRLDDLKVNLIDTPGHSDFVAEVERALAVLDGAIVVVSAVEGVQAQTRVLIRILERLRIPFLVFVNKIDRAGAAYEEVLAALDDALSGRVVALTVPAGLGARGASVEKRRDSQLSTELAECMADHDDAALARYIEGTQPWSAEETRVGLRNLTAEGHLHPTYFGAALMGTGVPEVLAGIGRYLTWSSGLTDAPLHATVFKIERGRGGQQVAFTRIRAGRLAPRDQVAYYRRGPGGTVTKRTGRVTSVRTFTNGPEATPMPALAGDIATVVGLADVEIGDQLGRWDPTTVGQQFAPPGLEAVVRPVRPADRPALFAALQALSEQDPLIDARLDGIDQEPRVSLYGEVQKEVLAARLAEEFGVQAEFLPTETVCVERVSGIGEALEAVPAGNATIGLRVEPGDIGSGFSYRLAVERGWLLPSFHTAIEQTLAAELTDGLFGWRVVDSSVTLIQSRFCAPTPSAGVFRYLTGIALRNALTFAGTTVCEPFSEFEVDMPAGALSSVLGWLAGTRATPGEPKLRATRCRLTGVMPTAEVQGFEQRLPSITQGQGSFVSQPAGYRPFVGPAPRRGRRQ